MISIKVIVDTGKETEVATAYQLAEDLKSMLRPDITVDVVVDVP